MKRARGRQRQWRRAEPGVATFRSPVMALVTALALLVQLVVPHQALSAPIGSPAPVEVASAAAELKATFGEAASLCVQTDGAGGPNSPAGTCDDHCPLCRFATQAAAVTPPNTPALPEHPDSACSVAGAAPEASGVSCRRRTGNCARAPPVAS